MEHAAVLAVPRADVDIEEFMVGDIMCEQISPKNKKSEDNAVLYAHGGGYITGGIAYARILAVKLCMATGFTVYSFAYSLAPEKPYPAALNDAEAVWNYLTEGRYAPEKLLIAGDSAGGNLALCLTQRLKACGRTLPARLLLFSPWTDMTASAPSYEQHENDDPILTKSYVEEAARAYLRDVTRAKDPLFSPLYGDLSGFPPVYIMVGRNEILLDDSLRLKQAIEEQGGVADIDIEENGWHVYMQMPVPIAGKALNRLADYVSGFIGNN
ncbi:MAG: alpha/beta hydrolase [Lachnospiraceae bacterium]|nr:alpha/beta hydrolase [Lachnospiraceae bacterium]